MTFYQKNGENIFAKIFHVGEIFVWSVYSLFFSTRKELDSDLNVGRRHRHKEMQTRHKAKKKRTYFFRPP